MGLLITSKLYGFSALILDMQQKKLEFLTNFGRIYFSNNKRLDRKADNIIRSGLFQTA